MYSSGSKWVSSRSFNFHYVLVRVRVVSLVPASETGNRNSLEMYNNNKYLFKVSTLLLLVFRKMSCLLFGTASGRISPTNTSTTTAVSRISRVYSYYTTFPLRSEKYSSTGKVVVKTYIYIAPSLLFNKD